MMQEYKRLSRDNPYRDQQAANGCWETEEGTKEYTYEETNQNSTKEFKGEEAPI